MNAAPSLLHLPPFQVMLLNFFDRLVVYKQEYLNSYYLCSYFFLLLRMIFFICLSVVFLNLDTLVL